MLEGQIDNIYQEVVGSGPYIYLPFTSLIFAPVSLLAFNTPYISFNPYSGFSFVALIAIIYKVSRLYSSDN